MMHILVTGATGFIGRSVAREALSRGHAVTALARSHARADATLSPHKNLRVEVAATLADYRPKQSFDRLIHLAWDGSYKYNDPDALLKNLPEQFDFLRYMAEAGLADMTVGGSCHEYGTREGMLHEDDPANGGTYYSLAKVTLYRMLLMLPAVMQNKMRLKWLRFFYVYGKDQRASSLCPQLLAAIERKDSSFDMSPGDQERDFISAASLAHNTLAVAEQEQVTGIINMGEGRAVKVIDFVRDIMRQKGHKMTLNCGRYPYPAHEPFSLRADVTKLKSVRGVKISDEIVVT